MTGGDSRYPVAQVQAWEPASLGTGPEAQGEGQHTAARSAPSNLLHQPHAGDRDLGGWCRASQSRPAYLEDRRQVLGHFQSLSLHRVDHILHPGAGAAMRQGGTVAIRAADSKTAPDVADWHRAPQAAPAGPGGRGGGTRRPGPAVTWRRRQRPSRPSERRVRAQPPGLFPPEAAFCLPAPLPPLPTSPSSFHSLPTAAPPPGPHVTRASPDT